MSQQLAILVLVDTAGALRAGTLDGNIYLVDNAKWNGSTGEGSGQLVSAVEGGIAMSRMETQVLNWLPCGLASIPRTVPQTFFLDQATAKAVEAAEAVGGGGGEPEPTCECHKPILRTIMGHVLDGTPERSFHPHPEIVNITGPAVDYGVILPAQYGSPDLFSDGLYWSATIDTAMVGEWPYTLHLAIYPPVHDADTPCEPVYMTHECRISISCTQVANGYLTTPMMIPA